MPPKERYGYAVARLRALENRLLDEAVFQRMIDCDTLEAAVKVLGETPYSVWLAELKSPLEFDKAIEAELHRCYEEIQGFTPETEIVSLLRLPYDIHNVKTLIKGQILAMRGGKRRLDLLTSLGNIDTDTLTLAVEGEDCKGLPFGLDRAVPEALAVWEQEQNMLAVEKSLDKTYFRALLKTAGDLKMEEVVKWVKSRIDGENLKTMLRLSHISINRAQTESFLYEGGTIPVNKLAPLALEPLESWSRLLGFSEISKLLSAFTEDANFNSQLVLFEKNLDDYITECIAPVRFATFEPANVVRYLWAREIEAKNLRVILVSVANGVNKDTIREVLRHVC